MANTQAMQESLLKAADIIVTQRINELQLDKTITAIVRKNVGQKNGKPVYQVYYSGGTFDAVCQSADDVYLPNTSVYVLIPQGNFSNEKIIIGYTKSTEIVNEKQINISESNIYSKLGINLLSFNENLTYGLHSWHEDNNPYDDDMSHRYKYIYQKGQNNDIEFNQEFLNLCKDETVALMLQADFQTNLAIEQRQQINAKYGLIFNFAFNTNDDYKYEQFILSSDQMLGNPFLFNQWNTQQTIIKIDLETLSHLDSIIFFQEGFLQDYVNEKQWPPSDPDSPDIWVKNLQICPLKFLSQNNEYSLKVEPYNETSSIINNISEETLQFKATFLRQFYEDLTSNINTKIYWFKESSSVNAINNINYNVLAGIGWKEIANSNNILTLSVNDNKAFKNNYKCIIQYNDIILDYNFSVYNENTIKLKLESNLGTKFSFNEDTLLTTIIKIKTQDEEEFKEKGYNEQDILFPQFLYTWCIINNNRDRIFLTETEENIINQLIKSTMLKNIKKETLLSNSNIVETENSQYATRIICPIKDINNNFSITCYVQSRDQETNEYYEIGSAQLDFINDQNNIDINNYKIEIENDDQVFKYDVYGKAPTDESNKDPLKIKPLSVKLKTLFDNEININDYQVEWIFPKEETSLLIFESADDRVCNFDIQKDYNPDCYSNQITCHITYNNINLYKDTKFYFGKEGDNGTNGTDIVAKIEYARNDDYKNVLAKEPVTLYIYNGKSFINTGSKYNMQSYQTIFQQKISEQSVPIFKVSLYQRSEKLNYSTFPIYSLAGNRQGRYFESGLNLSWFNNNTTDALPLIQNLKAEIQLNNSETYYAFISLPFIEYEIDPTNDNVDTLISIDKQYYLNEIVYNSDGRNPIYNHNKGLKLNLSSDIAWVEYSARGGFNKQKLTSDGDYYYPEFSPCFSLLENKESQVKKQKIIKMGLDKDIIYLIPDDNYSGSITNNRIEARCYDANNNLIATVYAPIYMSLNTFGLASLNAWDGNSVTIDNEGGYVMAPQIGAGEKDKNNRFTGILMGKTETYTGKAEKEKQIGLFGYTNGLQSIFLDAETGNATFGLPEGYTIKTSNNISIPSQDEDDYGEGRIELRPGGESKIGGWKIGRRSLYYTMKPIPIIDGIKKTITDYVTKPDGRYQYEYSGDIGIKYQNDEETPKNRDYAIHHRKDIKNHDSGILFSSDPPYMSIVGTMLTENDIVGDANAYLRRGDSIEIQLDPQTPTVFTIFRHNSEFRKMEALENNRVLGDRTFLAGINSRGQLQANIIGTTDDHNNQASMYFGLTKRFNQAVNDNTEYIGAIFEGGNNSITEPYMKLLIDKTEFDTAGDTTIDNVYISVPGHFDIDFAPTTFTGTTGITMTASSLKQAIENCLSTASSGLYIYNGTD